MSIKAILVDDERLALRHLEQLLLDFGEFEIIGKYQDPREALKAASISKPDIVFLDIEMPELNGIELAVRLQSQWPDINVVFITAYDEYAVKAFELNALDYALKPLQRDRLARTVQRLVSRENPRTSAGASVTVRCFQGLQINWGSLGAPRPVGLRWRTTKAQELFAYLLHHRGQAVSKDALLELLWPNIDGKKAMTQLYTTVYQTRKMLKTAGVNIIIHSHGESYVLDLGQAELDVDEWERGLREVPALSEATLSEHIRLLELYRGDYLADYDYLWAESERQRLRMLWSQQAMRVGEFLVANHDYLNAIALYHRIQMLHPYMESNYFTLMQLYDAVGDRSSVEREYERLETMLLQDYDVAPQEAILKWYRAWKADQDKIKNHSDSSPKKIIL
ncbi:response regulator [Paenibacillus sp. J2TS4]|uniref:response regulator n=1 Tax=Paenibacillus sp. J2TS4 TaxID=2807194 RepID=UPI001B2A42A3|nr:response regulator [Paenibacillus sp. J2TS4]GIP34175.1 DNA-binding response regulator [Paenibacillus sp. J2TS4]